MQNPNIVVEGVYPSLVEVKEPSHKIMRKVLKILSNVSDINNFDVSDEVTLIRGNAQDLCFGLFTEKKGYDGEMILQRYIPQGTTISVEVQFDNLDLANFIRRTATQPFAGDASIWCVPILCQDVIAFNSIRVVVVEDGTQTNFVSETDIATEEVGDLRGYT